MKLSIRLDIFYKSKRAKKTFNFFVVFLTAISFILTSGILLFFSENPTIENIVSSHEWLVILCFIVWIPSILWVLFSYLVDIAKTNDQS